MILGVIPARGGSKGILNKNIRFVAEKPLIAYTIDCAKKCPLLDCFIVSTDSKEIARIAKNYGADVPFLRPKELAQDTTPMLPVLEHAIIEYEKIYKVKVKCIVLLDPTGPLRTMDDIKNALELFNSADCDAVISANEAHRNPYFNMVIQDNNYIKLALTHGEPIYRRQDAPPFYDLNTLVWIYSRKAIMEEKQRIPKKSLLYLVPPSRALDIDTEFDLTILELLLKKDYT